MKPSVAHKTVRIKKTFRNSSSAVYAAFASAKARAEWAVPQGQAIKYSEANFKVGGKDVFRCGSPRNLEFKGIVQYHEIIRNQRFMSTETMMHSGAIISVALLTTEFTESGSATTVTITAQLASLDGNDMSKGYKQGWTAAFKNLARFLEK